MSLETVISVIILAIIVIAVLYIVSIWVYKRAPANMGFVRTGFRGTKVCLGRGAAVLPVFHEVTWISLETIKLVVSRARDQAILTSDKIRVDVVAELYAHVGHTENDLLTAARSLGEKTFDPDKVRSLLEAKIISALRSYAATKTLDELHENRDACAREIKQNVMESFLANGLTLEEVTIVTLEQTAKEHFNSDNVFDAEGLKVITEITSDARRKVHETEKQTTVAIRQKELATQLDLLEIERQEAFARANQDKEVSNEQALQVGQKQIYVLAQKMAVEQKEIDNEKTLENIRTERDINAIAEAKRREITEIDKALELEQARRDREITLIAKAKEEELANIGRSLETEQAERDRQIVLVDKAEQFEVAEIRKELVKEQARKDKEIELNAKEELRQKAEIDRITTVLNHEEEARQQRHDAAEAAAISMRQRSLSTRVGVLELDKEEALAAVRQEQEISNERARVLSEKQRYILEQRLHVERDEIGTALALEQSQIQKDIELVNAHKSREAAEISRSLAREQEERNREITLVAKLAELEKAEVQRKLARETEEREREVALLAKDTMVDKARVQRDLATELEQRERDITLITKEREREKADIQRFLARELEERDRQIAMAAKTREYELAEIERLKTTAEREKAEHTVQSVHVVADAERQHEVDRITARNTAEARQIAEENKAQITRMHLLTQAEARQAAAEREAESVLTRAKASSEAKQINAVAIEREAGAVGRAEMEVEQLRVVNAQRRLEAEASGIQAKAEALKNYNDQATYIELAKMHIEAERDVHIDQAKAMGNALQGAQIRMYGGGGGDGGTIDTIRDLFTKGFGIGETLEGIAQSIPDGLRDRLAQNGIRGLFGRPNMPVELRQTIERLGQIVDELLTTDGEPPTLAQALVVLEERATNDEPLTQALSTIRSINRDGAFDEAPLAEVWRLLTATARSFD